MKVAVLGASGRAGSEIVKELSGRGHDVLAIAQNPDRIPDGRTVVARAGDASDAKDLAPLIVGREAVISALRFDVPASTLLGAIREAGVGRFLVTGGAGSLEVASGLRLIDSPEFPDEWKPVAERGIAFLETLRATSDVNWTFFSPPAFIFEGPRLGTFRLGEDRLVKDDHNESRISFADYAIAMVDELEQHRFSRRRFTAAY